MTETGGGVEERSGENLSIRLEGIDTAAIMKEIETRVEERRRKGVYKDLDLLDLEEQRGEAEVSLDPLHELIFLNQLARQYADVTSHYPIGSPPCFLVAATDVV